MDDKEQCRGLTKGDFRAEGRERRQSVDPGVHQGCHRNSSLSLSAAGAEITHEDGGGGWVVRTAE